MEESIKKGYNYFEKNSSTVVGSFDTDAYIYEINDAIKNLEKELNSFKGTQKLNATLKGDLAEFWHAGTFNIDAITNRSGHRAFVDRSYDLGSVDISTNFGEMYGLKYYSTAIDSAKQQSKSVFNRYIEYKSSGGKDTIEKYLKERNYSLDSVYEDPIYIGQQRLIPTDQLKEATLWLEKRIITESLRRPEQVRRYQDTLNLLRDKIKDNEGNKSIELSKSEAEKLAQLAKSGRFDAEKYGLTVGKFLTFERVMKESLNAGLNAAVIAMIIKTAPEIVNGIQYLIKNGEIEEGKLKNIGATAINGSAEGFIRGTVSAALTTCCKSGLFGTMAKNIKPSVIAALTVLAMNSIKGAYEVAANKKTSIEYKNDIIRDMFLIASSSVGGVIGQATNPIPVLGYMIGSFVGSIVGSFIYSAGNKAILTFCLDTGLTLFGLVEQDYCLPEDIVNEIGLEIFKYETFEYETFAIETFKVDSFDVDTFTPDNLNIKFLRRGVIGVFKIGYTN